MKRIILFDGVCNLCNRSVQFILQRDPKGLHHFASLQGKAGQELIRKFNLPPNMGSFILIEDDTVYMKSTAALRVCRQLKGGWKLLTILFVIPTPFRDGFYQFVARNRYKWFGKNESCMLPLPEWKTRFLD
ncbi:thiol-disulfide oxidoreductase DCC family protein [Neobacillus sp. Marseille-QA0830]